MNPYLQFAALFCAFWALVAALIAAAAALGCAFVAIRERKPDGLWVALAIAAIGAALAALGIWLKGLA